MKTRQLITMGEYCPECGRKLKSKKYLMGYYTDEGTPYYGTVVYCPKWKFAELSHYTVSFDENQHEIIERY